MMEVCIPNIIFLHTTLIALLIIFCFVSTTLMLGCQIAGERYVLVFFIKKIAEKEQKQLFLFLGDASARDIDSAMKLGAGKNE